MEGKRSDVVLLLGILLALSVSVGILVTNIQSEQEEAQRTTKDSAAVVASVIAYIQPLVHTMSIDLLAQHLTQFSPDVLQQVAKYIVSSSDSPLDQTQKVSFIAALIHYYMRTDKQKLPASFIDWIINQEELFKDYPLLYDAAMGIHPKAITEVLSWFDVHQDFVEDALQNATEKAVDENNITAFETLLAHGVVLDEPLASSLLVRVVDNDKSVDFVSLLIKQGANIETIVDDKTVLMHAVERGNPAMVKVLLEQGADPQVLASPETGTPLQAAFVRGQGGQKNFVEIEQLLRDYDAVD